MGLEVSQLRIEDVDALLPQNGQRLDHRFSVDDEGWRRIVDGSLGWTCRTNGMLVACGGLALLWPGRAAAWAILTGDIGATMLSIHRHALSLLEEAQRQPEYARLETTVQTDWAPGHRWVKMLGFKAEGRMTRYDPFGRDHVLYARIATTWDHSSSSEPSSAL